MPLWLAPSSPVTPARSSTNVTGSRCSADVHQHLVERPVQERGVDADDRVQAAHRHARRRRHGVLLGDADVEDAVREGLRERGEPDRMHIAAVIATMSGRSRADLDDLVGEHAGPAGRLRQLDAGHRVERAGTVQVVGLVVLGRPVAVALARHAVHDHRAAELASARAARLSTAAMSCPSIGPTYFRPRSSNKSLRRKRHP